MGNRAVITTQKNFDNNGIGIYLHWNGGRNSVEAFLKYCEIKGYSGFNGYDDYAFARLTQVIANFFGGALSIGVDTVNNLDTDNWDNGVYIVEGWKIVKRYYMRNKEQTENTMNRMLYEINICQPKEEQLPTEDIYQKEYE